MKKNVQYICINYIKKGQMPSVKKLEQVRFMISVRLDKKCVPKQTLKGSVRWPKCPPKNQPEMKVYEPKNRAELNSI